MNYNIEQVEVLEFRKKKLKEQTKKLEDLISGKFMHYYKLVMDKNGEYSEEKAWKMIEEFMDAFRKYYYYFMEEEETYDKDFVLTEEVEQFLRSFFYCVLRIGFCRVTLKFDNPCYGRFDDFYEMAKMIGDNVIYDEREMHFAEMYEIPNAPFYYLNGLYEAVVGEKASASLDEDKVAAMKEKYADEIAEIEETWREFEEELGDYEVTAEELWQAEEDYRQAFDWYEEEVRWEQETYANDKEELANFLNKEMFAKQYLIFRDLYFKQDGELLRHMDQFIDGMLDIYLFEKNYTKFLDDDMFFDTYAMLRKATNKLQIFYPEKVKYYG